jgi:hypothetical protein
LSLAVSGLASAAAGRALASSSSLGEDLDGACEVGADRLLDRHVQVAERFELVRASERAGVDGAQAAGLDEFTDRSFGVLVV